MAHTREIRILLNLDNPEQHALNQQIEQIPKGQQANVMRAILKAHFEGTEVPDFPPFYYPSHRKAPRENPARPPALNFVPETQRENSQHPISVRVAAEIPQSASPTFSSATDQPAPTPRKTPLTF
jgi:hypothetical protein